VDNKETRTMLLYLFVVTILFDFIVFAGAEQLTRTSYKCWSLCKKISHKSHLDTKITSTIMAAIKVQRHETTDRLSSAPEPIQHIAWTDAEIEQLRRGIPDNQCPICLSTKFCNKFSCTRHINIVHLKRRPHHCAACEKHFGLRQLLQKHLDSKLNRICKPFYQDFLEQSSLANHLKENLRQLDGKGLVRLYSVLS